MAAEMTRLPPLLPVTAVKSYTAVSPARPATCADVDCGAYLNGWVTIVPEGSEHAATVRGLAGRYSFTEQPQPGGLVEFTFPPGQPCFQASRHRLPAEGRERWIVRGGDWRGNPRGEFTEHTRAEFWVEDFAGHQQRLADRLQEG